MSKVIVEISARHVHLSEKDLVTLFGEGAKLTNKRELSQPGQFLCEERVNLVGPKRTLERVSILGPTRPDTQVEISLTDARSIGVNAPVRESGDVKDSGVVKVVGPCGEVEIPYGVIAAKRHIHMTCADGEKYGIVDKQIVSVKIPTEDRALVFGDVVARVSDSYALAMHIDTDEANAACVPGSCIGEILD